MCGARAHGAQRGRAHTLSAPPRLRSQCVVGVKTLRVMHILAYLAALSFFLGIVACTPIYAVLMRRQRCARSRVRTILLRQCHCHAAGTHVAFVVARLSLAEPSRPCSTAPSKHAFRACCILLMLCLPFLAWIPFAMSRCCTLLPSAPQLASVPVKE